MLAELVKHLSSLLFLLGLPLLLYDLRLEFLLFGKYLAVDTALLEYHFIHGERAGLVGEYEFDLPHFLDQVGVAALGEPGDLIIDGDISPDKEGLPQLDDFQHHIEGDGDHVRVGHPVGEELHYQGYKAHFWIQVKVVVILRVSLRPRER